MLLIGDIIKVTANQRAQGQLCQNVFFYRVEDIPSGVDPSTMYEYIAMRFNVVWGILIRGVQSTDCLHTVYRVDNVTNGVDFGEITINGAGNVGGDPMPSFNAFNVLLRRTTGVTRNGSKRLGGLPESASTGNQINWTSGVKADVEALFAAPLVTADSIPEPFAFPVIVGRKKFTNGWGDTYYVLDLTKVNPVQSALVTASTTQRSRKAGHGE